MTTGKTSAELAELADLLQSKYANGEISINQVAKEACAALRGKDWSGSNRPSGAFPDMAPPVAGVREALERLLEMPSACTTDWEVSENRRRREKARIALASTPSVRPTMIEDTTILFLEAAEALRARSSVRPVEREKMISLLTKFQEHFGINHQQMMWKRTTSIVGVEMVHNDGDTLFFGDPNHQEPDDIARFELIVELANSVPSILALLLAQQPVATGEREASEIVSSDGGVEKHGTLGQTRSESPGALDRIAEVATRPSEATNLALDHALEFIARRALAEQPRSEDSAEAHRSQSET